MAEGGSPPGSGRLGPRFVPPHSLPVSDEYPVFIAPPLDLRAPIDSGYRRAIAEALLVEPAPESADERPLPDATEDEPARFVDGAVSRRPPSEEPAGNEPTLIGENRVVLLQLLRSIGPVPRAPASMDGRPSKDAILLGRERALRFRVAMLDLWEDDQLPPSMRFDPASAPDSGAPARPHALDALLQASMMVAFADDPEPDPEALTGARDTELFGAIIHAIRDTWPALGRQVVRDAGAAACARVSVLGPSRALDMLANVSSDLDDEAGAATALLIHLLSDLIGRNAHETAATVRKALARPAP